MIKIEKNIPMRKGSIYDEIFEQMEVGDSFFVDGLADVKLSGSKIQLIKKSAYRWGRRNKICIVLATKAEGSGRRFWCEEKKPQSW